MAEEDVSMYLIHPAFKPRLDEWLESQGMVVQRTPWLDDDAQEEPLPTYLVAVGEELMRRARQPE